MHTREAEECHPSVFSTRKVGKWESLRWLYFVIGVLKDVIFGRYRTGSTSVQIIVNIHSRRLS